MSLFGEINLHRYDNLAQIRTFETASTITTRFRSDSVRVCIIYRDLGTFAAITLTNGNRRVRLAKCARTVLLRFSRRRNKTGFFVYSKLSTRNAYVYGGASCRMLYGVHRPIGVDPLLTIKSYFLPSKNGTRGTARFYTRRNKNKIKQPGLLLFFVIQESSVRYCYRLF